VHVAVASRKRSETGAAPTGGSAGTWPTSLVVDFAPGLHADEAPPHRGKSSVAPNDSCLLCIDGVCRPLTKFARAYSLTWLGRTNAT